MQPLRQRSCFTADGGVDAVQFADPAHQGFRLYVKINGVSRYTWRAVDHEGEVLDSFVTKTRDRKAALILLKKSMNSHDRPVEIVTDRLLSYGATLKDPGRGDDSEMVRRSNNRAENSDLPFRRRERAMLQFRPLRRLQKFC